jgi:hypothetical protein
MIDRGEKFTVTRQRELFTLNRAGVYPFVLRCLFPRQ